MTSPSVKIANAGCLGRAATGIGRPGPIVLFLSVALAGCGTTEYNKRFEASLTQVSARAAFDQTLHSASTDVVDATGQKSGVSLRLPRVLDDKSKSLPPADKRAQPPFVKLPGLGYTLERLLDDSSQPAKFAPAYCYLAAVPKADQKADELQADVQRQISGALGAGSWQDVQVDTLSGQKLPVRLISIKGQQEFDGGQSGGPVERLDGQIDLYFVDAPKYHVLIGFRCPAVQAEKYKFFEAGRAAVGSIEGVGGGAGAE